MQRTQRAQSFSFVSFVCFSFDNFVVYFFVKMNFKTQNLFKSSYQSGVLIVFLASLILYLLEWRNQGINLLDFEVYYRSAARLMHGENLYRIASDDYFIFKYSPVSAMFYIPFIVFPLTVAKNVYWLFLTIIAASSFLLCFKLAMPDWDKTPTSKKYLFFVLLMLSLGVHIYREFALGQVNIILFFSYLLIIRFYQLKKPLPVAIILAIGIFFKPWGLIFIPYFFIKKEYRTILYVALVSLLLLVLPIVFYGFSGLVEQTGKWFSEMAIEMGNKQDLGAFGNHTIFSVLYRYTPIHLLGNSPVFQTAFQLVILILLALLVLLFMKKGLGTEKNEVAEGALLIGLMPLIAPAAYNTFLLLGLAIALLMLNFKKLPVWIKVLFVAGIVVQGGNFYDIWGNELSNRMIDFSLVAIGAVAILTCLIFARFKKII